MQIAVVSLFPEMVRTVAEHGVVPRSHGHEVRLIAAQFVKPYVKSNKNDRVDAEELQPLAQHVGERLRAVDNQCAALGGAVERSMIPEHLDPRRAGCGCRRPPTR